MWDLGLHYTANRIKGQAVRIFLRTCPLGYGLLQSAAQEESMGKSHQDRQDKAFEALERAFDQVKELGFDVVIAGSEGTKVSMDTVTLLDFQAPYA